MNFSESIKNFSTRIEQLKANITTEEATKTAMVLPFFQLLGYDVFNPLEFVPEFTADTGTKKGEKVDYAILQNGDPTMIIEVKPVNTELSNKHLNQLFRYFTVTKARFGILTNGVIYKFYSDLDEANKMDSMPFMEINLLNLKPRAIKELNKFQKECFDVKEILNSASDLKYTSLLKTAIEEQFNDPSEQFVRALIKNIYTGTKTQAIIDRFKEMTRIAINDYISDLLNQKLQSVLSRDISGESSDSYSVTPEEKEYDFLPEELEALDYVKNTFNFTNVAYKKTSGYAYMYIEDSPSKWIFRIYIQQKRKLLVLHKFNDTTYETEYYFDDVTLLEQLEELIKDVYQRLN